MKPFYLTVLAISVKFKSIINMYMGPFSEPPEIFLFEKPCFEELYLKNFITNDLVLTSQEWYCFMDFISNLVVENMTKTQHFCGNHERRRLFEISRRRLAANIKNDHKNYCNILKL